jgi:stage II sporulation protein GA (sporulation sigma-E factor processing peptidase)
MVYLDIVLIVNGVMDTFLLLFTAYLLRKKIYALNILMAVFLGEFPIISIFFGLPGVTAVSKIFVPLAMIGVGLKTKAISDLAKGLLYFSLLAAVTGGICYALFGWLGLNCGKESLLTLHDLWILPLIALMLMGGYRVWEKGQRANLFLDNILYDAELCFEDDKILKVKALLDTGNELRDPLTGAPVMLLEEKVAQKVIPEKIRHFLELPWRESSNPWSFVWKDEEYCRQRMVFISAKGINGQTWLPGIRLGKAKISQGAKEWECPVTVAFVPQVLSSESKFQALLHPDHIPKIAGKEEIA